jgi:hypothetical protein
MAAVRCEPEGQRRLVRSIAESTAGSGKGGPQSASRSCRARPGRPRRAVRTPSRP